MAYLDDTGLAYFWGKIKAYVIALLTSKANDTDVVHKTGDETVTGTKGFEDIIKYDEDIEKGVLPSERAYYSLAFCDKNYATENIPNNTRLGLVEGYIEPDGSTSFGINGFNFVRGNSSACHISCIYDAVSNINYVDSSPILNRVNDGTTSFRVKHLNRQRTVAPDTRKTNVCLYGSDADDKGLWGLYSVQETDNQSYTRLIQYKSTTTDAQYAYVGAYSDSDGRLYAAATTTPNDANGNEVVVASWANGKFLPLTGGTLTSSYNVLNIKSTNDDNTVAPSSHIYTYIEFHDKNNLRTGWVGFVHYQSTSTRGSIVVRKHNSSEEYAMGVEVDSSGNAYGFCPTPPDNSNSTTIATTSWVNRNCVKIAGDQTITGLKTFTNNIIIKSGSIVSNVNPSTTLYSFVQFHSKDGATISNAGYAKYPDGSRCYTIYLYGGSTKRLAYDYDNDNLTVTPDNAVSLGAANLRWKQLYAGTTVISTSDERLKDSISPVPDEVLDAWAGADFVQFRMKDAVAGKGAAARLHSGMVAQDIQRAFAARGLDASGYGLFCYDSWDAKEALRDESGEILEEAVPAGDRYSLRYEEALCMEAAYMRRENVRLKKRVADLEERLAALELKIA